MERSICVTQCLFESANSRFFTEVIQIHALVSTQVIVLIAISSILKIGHIQELTRSHVTLRS